MSRNRLSQNAHPLLKEHPSDNLQKINQNVNPLSSRRTIYPISSEPIMAKTLSTSRATITERGWTNGFHLLMEEGGKKMFIGPAVGSAR
jgi:hypothetical protein